MSIKTIPQLYSTSDGASFGTMQEAELWQWVLNAKHDFDMATKELGEALAAVEKTADGKPLMTDSAKSWVGKRFWVIHHNYGGLPALEEIRLYLPHGLKIRNGDDSHKVVVEYQVGERKREIPVSELYASQKAAEIALFGLMVERMDRYQAEVDELAKRIGETAQHVQDISETKDGC